MNIFEQLSRQPIKSSPDVWVRRLAIFGKLSDKPIRDIPLRKGLNIVWAEEPESENDTSDIAGHSAGKTSFCRLLRYVLGEKTYANKENAVLIQQSFPNGYVAAELIVKGVQWAVMRPLGDNRNSYVLKEKTIEELIKEKGEPAYQDTYPEKLGLDDLLNDLASSTVVRTNQAIKWGHLLAWCTRDQEARFQNIYDWRSTRSDSQWPAFRFPKSDPLFVMRIALGLFLRDELEGEEKLSELLQSLEKEEASLENAKREPAYWHQYYDTKVRQQLKAVLPNDGAAIDVAAVVSEEIIPDLKRYTEKAKYELGETVVKIEAEQTRIQNEVNSINETISEKRTESNQLKALFQIEKTAESEASAGLRRNEDFKKRTAEHLDKNCPFGDVLIGNCSYVQKRQELLSHNAIHDAHTFEQREAKSAEERAKLVRQQEALQKSIQANESLRTNLTKQQGKLLIEVEKKQELQLLLDTDLGELKNWKTRHESPEQDKKLEETVKSIERLRSEIDAKKAGLNQLLSEHDDNRNLLSAIFSAAAKKVLPSSAYDGKVGLEDRELAFQITHGGAMSGEAMETLAVLLADISCLIYNSISSRSYLPGFLLHDSPREADLGLRHYQRFIRFAAELDSGFQKSGGCPFQYILTTTTPPPRFADDEDYLSLKLDASQESELLFRRNLSKPPENSQLQLIEGQ